MKNTKPNMEIKFYSYNGKSYKYISLNKSRETCKNEVCGSLPYALMLLNGGEIDFLVINKTIVEKDSFYFKTKKKNNKSKQLKYCHLIYEGINIEKFKSWEIKNTKS